jgi:hypothetical protein
MYLTSKKPDFLFTMSYNSNSNRHRQPRGEYKDYRAQGERINPIVALLLEIGDFNRTASLLEEEYKADPLLFATAFDHCLPQLPLNSIGRTL